MLMGFLSRNKDTNSTIIMETGTLLQKRRKTTKIGKEETLLILRGYLSHPTNWPDVIEEVRQNLDRLPREARLLYQTGSNKQLRDRMSTKFGKVMKARTEDIADQDIRAVVEDINRMERRLIQPEQRQRENQREGQADRRGQSPQRGQDVQPGTSRDRRDEAAAALSTDSGEEVAAAEDPPRNRRPRKRPLAYLIRENHELYNRFIKYKVPNLLRQLGVSSSETESD